MKTNGNDKALESYKIFPFIAWGITIGFAFFVYSISVELKTVTEELQADTVNLKQQIESLQ